MFTFIRLQIDFLLIESFQLYYIFRTVFCRYSGLISSLVVFFCYTKNNI